MITCFIRSVLHLHRTHHYDLQWRLCRRQQGGVPQHRSSSRSTGANQEVSRPQILQCILGDQANCVVCSICVYVTHRTKISRDCRAIFPQQSRLHSAKPFALNKAVCWYHIIKNQCAWLVFVNCVRSCILSRSFVAPNTDISANYLGISTFARLFTVELSIAKRIDRIDQKAEAPTKSRFYRRIVHIRQHTLLQHFYDKCDLTQWHRGSARL